MKTLIVYYSLGGNTKRIAEMIQSALGGDLMEIKTQTPYTGSYDSIVDQGQREVNRGFMPEIQPLSCDLSQYDRIILGTPVWWYTFAPAVKTFLSQTDWTGKTVWPYATNGGWLGHTFKDIQTACKGADVKAGMDIVFDENRLRTSEKEVRAWISRIR